MFNLLFVVVLIVYHFVSSCFLPHHGRQWEWLPLSQPFQQGGVGAGLSVVFVCFATHTLSISPPPSPVLFLLFCSLGASTRASLAAVDKTSMFRPPAKSLQWNSELLVDLLGSRFGMAAEGVIILVLCPSCLPAYEVMRMD